MQNLIRLIQEKDKPCVIEMMREFYSSPAVFTNGSEQIFEADVDNCIAKSPYLEGYVFENDGIILGYAMIAKSFSTEFGKPCIWIEDLYLKPKYRKMGIGNKFLSYIETKYPNVLFRLEVEEENQGAMHLYQKHGYQILPYTEMKK
jgi:ribosomal protein S18 acetylase RimI-like enzyme